MMSFRRGIKTLSINQAFCCVLLSAVFLFSVQLTVAQPPIIKQHSLSMEEILPDTPESEYPVIMSEALIPQSFQEERLTWPGRKRVMQVHRAAFNIPIAEEDLRFSD